MKKTKWNPKKFLLFSVFLFCFLVLFLIYRPRSIASLLEDEITHLAIQTSHTVMTGNPPDIRADMVSKDFNSKESKDIQTFTDILKDTAYHQTLWGLFQNNQIYQEEDVHSPTLHITLLIDGRFPMDIVCGGTGKIYINGNSYSLDYFGKENSIRFIEDILTAFPELKLSQ